MTEKEKDDYINLYKKREEIELRKDRICNNPGLHYIAKLCVNSLWGKFSMRNNLSKVEFIDSPSRLYQLLQNPSVEVQTISQVSENRIRVMYKFKNRFIGENSTSNIVISLWTTSLGRCALNKYMENCEELEKGQKGQKLLYVDTDSCFVSYPKGQCPLKDGKFLGEMTLEYKDKNIRSFVSGGNKQYAFEMVDDSDSSKISHKMKLRGITLDSGNAEKLSFDNFREMVRYYGHSNMHFYYAKKITLSSNSRVYARPLRKMYRPIFEKANIVPDESLTIYPFGYF